MSDDDLNHPADNVSRWFPPHRLDLGPPEECSAHIEGMAVTVTLVFACESHREMWLRTVGYLGKDDAKDRDYDRRRSNTNLAYTVGVLGGSDRKSDDAK